MSTEDRNARNPDLAREVATARESAVLHDRSHWGRLRATGKDVVDLLHRLSTNDLRGLASGRGAATVFTDADARIVDRVEILALEDGCLLVTSPGQAEGLSAWIDRFTISEDVALADVTRETALLTLHGPRAEEILSRLFPGAPFPTAPFAHVEAAFSTESGGSTPVRIARGRPLALTALDLHVAASGAESLRAQLFETGRGSGLASLSEKGYEILRIEAGRPALGAEMSRDTNPHEAGVIEDVSFTKGCYIGQEVVARLDTYEKVQRFLRGIRFEGEDPPAPGAVLRAEGKEVGRITSAVVSPREGRAIALALVRKGWADPGTKLETGAGSGLAGVVVTLPFVDPNG